MITILYAAILVFKNQQHLLHYSFVHCGFTLILIQMYMYYIKHWLGVLSVISVFEQPLWSPELIPAIASETSSMGSSHCTFCKATVPSDLMYSHLNSHFQDKEGDWQSQNQELLTSRCLGLFMALLPVLYAQWARHTAATVAFHSEHGGRGGLHAHLFKL